MTVDEGSRREYLCPMETQELIVDGDERGIVQLILNRPAQLNAWTVPLEAAFFAALPREQEGQGEIDERAHRVPRNSSATAIISGPHLPSARLACRKPSSPVRLQKSPI